MMMNDNTIDFVMNKARVLETVYALSALRTYHRDAPRPLGRDEAPALMKLMEAAAANVMAELLPHVADADIRGADSLTLTLRVPRGVTVTPSQQIVMGVKLEEAVALGVLELSFDAVCPVASAEASRGSIAAARAVAAPLDILPAGTRLAPGL